VQKLVRAPQMLLEHPLVNSCFAFTRAKSAVCWLMLTKFATKSKTTISIFYASGIAGKRTHNIVLTNFYIFAAMPHKAALAQGASYGRHANILRPAITALASF
jgi:hypothetical protein